MNMNAHEGEEMFDLDTNAEWLSLKEAADLYDINPETLRRYCKKNLIPARRGEVGSNGERPWEIHKKDLIEAEKRIPVLRRKRRVIYDKADRVIVDRLLEKIQALTERSMRSENQAKELQDEKENQIKLLAVTETEKIRWQQEAEQARKETEEEKEQREKEVRGLEEKNQSQAITLEKLQGDIIAWKKASWWKRILGKVA